MHRRQFCFAFGAFAAASYRGSSLAAATSADARRKLIARESRALGTTVRMLVRHESRRTAESAITAALNEVELVESLMSIYRFDSQLSRLNREQQLNDPHPYLMEVIGHASRVARETAGAFDITVQPLWKLHKTSTGRGLRLDPRELENARRSIGHHNVELTGNRIRLKKGACVTLNGIAQGFATDRAKQMLLKHGIRDALIDVGELAGFGTNDRDQSWKAGIQHPRNENAFVAVAPIENRCLATSGDYQTSFTDDFLDHHVFDPRTGTSPRELASVSVLAPTATQADALSTAMLVLGIRRSARLLSKQKRVDAMFVRKDGRLSATHGFPVGTDA